MPLSEVQRTRIYKYAKRGDRETEPVFVGRNEEIEIIDDGINMAAESYHKGRTICLSGPPGIGKTVLLEECRKRVEKNNSAIWVTVAPDDFNNPDSVVRYAAETVAQMPADRINRSGWGKFIGFCRKWLPGVKLETTLNLFITQFKLTPETDKNNKKQSAQKPFTGVPWAALGRLRNSVKGAPPFVIAVDEAHQLPGSDGQYGSPNKLLRGLHAGGKVPIVPILAGHVHTPEVIEKSISQRLAEDQSLFMTNLTKSESKDYVRGVLEYLEAEGDIDAIADWIYGESDGFPHHIRGGLSSIAKCMLKTNSLRIADLDTNAIEQAFSEGRCNYYGNRLRSPVIHYRTAISPVLKAMEPPDTLSEMDIIEMLQIGIRDMMESRTNLNDLEPINSSDLFKQLVHRGAIARTAEDSYTCLIRSLARYAHSKDHAPHTPFPSQKSRPRKSSSPAMGNLG